MRLTSIRPVRSMAFIAFAFTSACAVGQSVQVDDGVWPLVRGSCKERGLTLWLAQKRIRKWAYRSALEFTPLELRNDYQSNAGASLFLPLQSVTSRAIAATRRLLGWEAWRSPTRLAWASRDA